MITRLSKLLIAFSLFASFATSVEAFPQAQKPVSERGPDLTEESETCDIPTELADQIDSMFERYNTLDSPGLVITAMRGSETVFQKAYGAANLEHRVPIHAKKTLFNIGSTSKQFTAFALLLLAEEGKLSIDDDVRKFIPELPEFDQVITLRHLANHTSGIRSELSLLAMAGWTPGDMITKSQVLRMIKRQKELNFEPGEDFSYSNSGYTLMAEVVARVSGISFGQYCEQNIFRPLGMNDSLFADGPTNLKPNMAYSYGPSGESFYPQFPNDEYPGSTGLWTTAPDIARWASNLRDPKVGSKQLIEQMNTSGVLKDGHPTGYGMGQMIETYRGATQVQHGGGTSGYVSYLCRFPDQDLTVALIANCPSIAAKDMSFRVVDLFLKSKTEPTPENKDARIQLTDKQLDRLVGRYWNLKDRTSQILKGDNSLVYAIDGGPRITLAPINEFEFEMLNIGVKSKAIFKPNGHGNYTMHTMQERGEVNVIEKYEPKDIATTELEKFTGRYFSEELGTIYEIKSMNDQLMVNHVRFNNISLTPVIDDIFRSSGWRFTSIKFERDKNQFISGFRASSMRNRNLLFQKMK